MNDLLLVSVTYDFSNLGDQVQLNLDAQFVFSLSQIVVQPHAERIVLKQQGRA